MKVHCSRKDETLFEPVTVSITFETLREAQDFYSMLNYTPICESIGLDLMEIRRAVSNKIRGFTYDEAFDSFLKKIERHFPK